MGYQILHLRYHNPELNSTDENPLTGPRNLQPGKVSVKLPADDWLCRKLEKLNITLTEGYSSHTSESSGLHKDLFIALIHPTQWTIANPVKADQPAKRQKNSSCVSIGWACHILCICQVAYRTSFLSRKSDIMASFLFGTCTMQKEFCEVLRSSSFHQIINSLELYFNFKLFL